MTIYVTSIATEVKAAKHIQAEGEVVSGRDGAMVRSPWVMIHKQAADTVLKLTGELGCTPSSRARLQTTSAEGDDFDNFLKRKGI